MGPYKSSDALKNLKRGVKKMEKAMSPAAEVRRQFRLGRPPKGTLPLHPTTAWQKAESLLADFRQKMQAKKLRPEDVDGQIIGVREADPGEPVFISLADREAALRTLSAPDIIAIGCIFRQHDSKSKENIDFFVQFTGLSEQGLGVLRKAAEMQHNMGRLISSQN